MSIIVVDVAIGFREAFARFSRPQTRIDETNVIDWAVAVVDVAVAEVDRATVHHGRHAVHLVTAEQRRLESGLTDTVHVD